MLGVAKKQPGDTLDYDVDFERWIPEGDSLVVSSAVADDPGIIIGDVEVIPPLVKVWLSAGISGRTYKITVTTTTAQGRIKEVDFLVRVNDC